MQRPTAEKDLNLKLPDANLKDDKSLNKLSYYEKAASDPAKLEELMKNDTSYKQHKQAEIEGLAQCCFMFVPAKHTMRLYIDFVTTTVDLIISLFCPVQNFV